MKKIKTITIILLIVLITMISFFGIYVHVQNRMENKVKDYELDMDLGGARYVTLVANEESTEVIKDANGNEVTTEDDLTDEELTEKGYTKESVPNNSEENLTVENYNKSKKIVEERLKFQGVNAYEIAVNEENGNILIQIPENDSTDNFVSNINTTGDFRIVDAETNEVLMTNDDIKSASVMYGRESSTSTATTVYLDIQFTKEGAEKLENISKTYTAVDESEDTNTTTDTNTTNTATDSNTTEEGNITENSTDTNNTTDTENAEDTENTEKTTKEITMIIDDQTIMTTSFDQPIENGRIQLSIGSATTNEETLQGYVTEAVAMASILDSGKLPITYDLDTNEYIESDITNTKIQYVALAIGIICLIGIIILIFRYKLNGFLAGIAFIGLISLYLLVLRYTNVNISIQGIVGIIATLILNYIFVNKILLKIKTSEDSKNLQNINEAIKNSYKEFFLRIVPVCISVIAFCFMGWTILSSFGMVMFWGIALIALYNYIITATMLKIRAEK